MNLNDLKNFFGLHEKSLVPNVGIGTTTPRARLDVAGAIVSAPATAATGATISFADHNIRHTTQNCQAYALHHLKDGGTYTFIVKGTTATTCSFTAFVDAGVTPLDVSLPPGHGATFAGERTVYTFLVAGSEVFVAWVPGYGVP